MSIVKGINLELFKLKHRYFYLTWLLLSIPVIAYMVYDLKDFVSTTYFIYENSDTYYYDVLLKALMLFGLMMPISAGVLISKLMDEEHQADNWKLLLTSNSTFYELWYSKFLVVFTLMELTTLVVYLVIVLGVYFNTGFPIPATSLLLSFLAVSGVNIISLTIAEYFATYFKNQLIVLTISLIGGFLGIIAPLMPQRIVAFIPWGYYIVSSLCITETVGREPNGHYIYQLLNVEPNYTLICSVILLFLVLNFICAYMKSYREV